MQHRPADTAQASRKRARHRPSRTALGVTGVLGFATLLGWSAAVAFQRHADPVPLAATDRRPQAERSEQRVMGQRPAPRMVPIAPVARYEEVGAAGATPRVTTAAEASAPSQHAAAKYNRDGQAIYVDGQLWTGEVFDYRPIRPVSTRMMKTTAYSPDERSCGKWADGITASGKSVWMNGGRLAAADRAVPYGTILTIPGYNSGQPVQVWDRGGKIKGNRLDLLYPTHEIALQWGVQDLPVVFWEFVEAD